MHSLCFNFDPTCHVAFSCAKRSVAAVSLPKVITSAIKQVINSLAAMGGRVRPLFDKLLW